MDNQNIQELDLEDMHNFSTKNSSTQDIINTAKRTGARAKDQYHFLQDLKDLRVNKSPHIDKKKSRDQLESKNS